MDLVVNGGGPKQSKEDVSGQTRKPWLGVMGYADWRDKFGGGLWMGSWE